MSISGATWTLSGTNTIASVTDNGTLVVTGSLPAANYQIGSASGGGTLEVASAPGTALPISFAGNSTLVIDNAAAFGANVGTSSYTGPLIENFGAGETVDIKNVSSSGASLTYNSATGLLQIVNGSQSASLDFQTSTLGSGNFTLAPDAGGSGLYLTLSSGPTVTERLVSDTGSSSTDKITSNDALTGTAAANAAVTLSEGGTTLGTVSADATGLWNFTPASLTQGVHTIVAASGSASAPLTFTYDTVQPAVTEYLLNNIGSPRPERDGRWSSDGSGRSERDCHVGRERDHARDYNSECIGRLELHAEFFSRRCSYDFCKRDRYCRQYRLRVADIHLFGAGRYRKAGRRYRVFVD